MCTFNYDARVACQKSNFFLLRKTVRFSQFSGAMLVARSFVLSVELCAQKCILHKAASVWLDCIECTLPIGYRSAISDHPSQPAMCLPSRCDHP